MKVLILENRSYYTGKDVYCHAMTFQFNGMDISFSFQSFHFHMIHKPGSLMPIISTFCVFFQAKDGTQDGSVLSNNTLDGFQRLCH